MTDNEIIAEFLDGTKFDESGLCTDSEKKYSYRIGSFEPLRVEHLQYHNNWNWLMPVVDKISNMLVYGVKIEYSRYSDSKVTLYTAMAHDFDWNNTDCHHIQHYGKNVIEITYQAVVEFIKWYNQQKEKKD